MRQSIIASDGIENGKIQGIIDEFGPHVWEWLRQGLDDGRESGRIVTMRFGSFNFGNGFAGWYYFSPSGWRLRLR